MGLKKRFLVVVVGVVGSPAEAQRSEVGRFRSRSAAEQAGVDEWRRILFVHAPHIDRYRIVIEDDGAEVADIPMPELPAETAPGLLDETVTPLGASMGALGEPINPEPAADPEPPPAPVVAAVPEPAAEPESAPEPAVEPQPAAEAIESTGELEVITDEPDVDDLAATGEHKGLAADIAATGEVPVVAKAADETPADEPHAPSRPYIAIEEPPDGPVPEDIIQRFADMVKAEEERAAERSVRERGDRG
jgi:hypothetical protein